jgi:hypothetical protein
LRGDISGNCTWNLPNWRRVTQQINVFGLLGLRREQDSWHHCHVLPAAHAVAVSQGVMHVEHVSAYDGIRWGTGLPRHVQYERAQSRIGATVWQAP